MTDRSSNDKNLDSSKYASPRVIASYTREPSYVPSTLPFGTPHHRKMPCPCTPLSISSTFLRCHTRNTSAKAQHPQSSPPLLHPHGRNHLWGLHHPGGVARRQRRVALRSFRGLGQSRYWCILRTDRYIHTSHFCYDAHAHKYPVPGTETRRHRPEIYSPIQIVYTRQRFIQS